MLTDREQLDLALAEAFRLERAQPKDDAEVMEHYRRRFNLDFWIAERRGRRIVEGCYER